MKGTHKNSEGLQSNVSLCKYTTTLGTSDLATRLMYYKYKTSVLFMLHDTICPISICMQVYIPVKIIVWN